MLKGQLSFLYIISSFFWSPLGKELPRAKQQRNRSCSGTVSLLTSPSLGTNVHMVDTHALSRGVELYLENTLSVSLKNLLYSFLRKINTLLLTDRIERTNAAWEAGYYFQRTTWNMLSLKHTEAYSIKKSTSNKCWRGCGRKGTLLHCWWECKLMRPLWKIVWRPLKNEK